MGNTTNAILKNAIWADGTTNKEYSQIASVIQNGIVFQSGVKSNQINGVLHFSYVTMRYLQVTAGLYDNTQDYDQNQIATILTAENGIKKIRRYICKQDGTTGKPPFKGDNKTEANNIEVVTIDDTNVEDPSRWDRILYDDKITASFATTNGNMALLCPANIADAEGRMRVKCFDNSDVLHCSFYLEFFGFGYQEFKIARCLYSQSVKQTRISTQYGGIYYAGFGIMVTNGGLYLSVLNNTKCSKVVVEYSDCNFIPPLTQTTNATPSSTNKPYAIREGGGTFIKDLGVVKNDYRQNGTSTSQESLEFYLFSNGFVRWTSAMTLNANYFHQWSNGNFGSLNVDVSDRVFRNVGTNATQTLGTLLEDAIRNITAEWALMDDNAYGSRSTTFQSMYNISAWYPSDSKGAFYIKRQSTEEAKITYSQPSTYTTGINAGLAGTPVTTYLGNIAGINASNQVPTANENRGKSLTIIAVAQAF